MGRCGRRMHWIWKVKVGQVGGTLAWESKWQERCKMDGEEGKSAGREEIGWDCWEEAGLFFIPPPCFLSVLS